MPQLTLLPKMIAIEGDVVVFAKAIVDVECLVEAGVELRLFVSGRWAVRFQVAQCYEQ